jgi:hypothetical protein
MPFEAFSFDDSVGRTEQARARVPEGYYLVEAEKVDPTPADYERTTGVFVTWRICEGPRSNPGVGKGGKLRDYNTMKKDAQFGLGMTLGAIGMEQLAKGLAGRSIANYQAFQALCGQLESRMKGKRAVALIADQPGNNGRPFSGIESLFPVSQWDELSGAMVVASNGPLPTNSTGAAVRPPADDDNIFAELDSR